MLLMQLLLSGVAQGCIYGLIALGFVLIYKATETVSFAQGDLMMLGAFAGLALVSGLGLSFWLALPIAMGFMALFGILLERVAIRPILGEPAFTVVMLTIGIGYLARGIITMVPGVGSDTLPLDVPYKDVLVSFGEANFSAEHLVIIAATLLLCAVLFALFRFTRIGIAMQAASQNQLAAYYMGIPVRRINGLVWGLASAVATVAGMLLVGLRESANLNLGLVVLKIAALVAFVALTLPAFDPERFTPFLPFGFSGQVGPDGAPRGVMAAAALIFFAFYGFDAISTAAEEAENPGRDLTLGIIGSMAACAVIYMAVAAVAGGGSPWRVFSESGEPLAFILRSGGHDLAAVLIAAVAVVALPTVILPR